MAIKVFGHEVSTPQAVAIGAGTLLAIWFAYKQHKATQAANSSSAIDPVTGLPYSQDQQIDPLTGMAYLQEAQQYGSVAAAEQAVAGEASLSLSSGAGTSTGFGLTGSSTGVTGTGTVTDVPSSGFASNADWVAAVTAGLTQIGYSASDVSSALRAYLAGLPETNAEAGITDTALAEFGPPPVGSFTVILASSAGPTGSGSGNGGGTPVFGNGGPGPEPKPPHNPPPAPAWISEQWVNRTQTNVHWAPSAGATSYQVRVTYQSREVQVQDTAAQNYTISGLTPDHTYGIHVVAINGNGWSPETSTVVKTTK